MGREKIEGDECRNHDSPEEGKGGGREDHVADFDDSKV